MEKELHYRISFHNFFHYLEKVPDPDSFSWKSQMDLASGMDTKLWNARYMPCQKSHYDAKTAAKKF